MNPSALQVASRRCLGTSSLVARWHKDKVENRYFWRYGYKDKVKQSGALPRLDEDAKKIDEMPIFTPENPYAPKRALWGQNDYIDILGDNPDALKPHEAHYHMPKYLRGVSGYNNDYQQALKLKAHLAETATPEVKPKDWDFLTGRIDRRYRELRVKTDQNLWKNYRGIKMGPIEDPFKTQSP